MADIPRGFEFSALFNEEVLQNMSAELRCRFPSGTSQGSHGAYGVFVTEIAADSNVSGEAAEFLRWCLEYEYFRDRVLGEFARLVELAKRSEDSVRIHALRAMACFGPGVPKEGVDATVACLRTPSDDVRVAAIDSLSNFGRDWASTAAVVRF